MSYNPSEEILKLEKEIKYFKDDFNHDCSDAEVQLAKDIHKRLSDRSFLDYKSCRSIIQRECNKEGKWFNHFQFEAFCTIENNLRRIESIKEKYGLE